MTLTLQKDPNVIIFYGSSDLWFKKVVINILINKDIIISHNFEKVCPFR